jgi:hypothetical protein
MTALAGTPSTPVERGVNSYGWESGGSVRATAAVALAAGGSPSGESDQCLRSQRIWPLVLEDLEYLGKVNVID